MKEFFEFIKKQGVMGLAIGFILGSSVTKVVTALVTDIINPLIGLFLGQASKLTNASISIFSAKVLWGDFVSTLIDFLIVALVAYAIVKLLRLDK